MPKRRVKRHAVTQPPNESYRLIPLTQGQNAIVDTFDFEFISGFNWYAAWCKDTKSFYAQRFTRASGVISMQRQILGCKTGEFADHKNHDTLDNRRNNLRKCSRVNNGANQRKFRTNRSGYKGVNSHHGKWQARITFKGKTFHLGRFESPEEAAKAYDKAAKEFSGEFAYTNAPENS